MANSRLAPLRVGASLLLLAANTGCGSRALSIQEPNGVDGAQSGANVAQVGLQRAPRGNPPVRLTSSDGTDLRLTQLAVKGVAAGPLAFTELHLSFKNAEARTIEGRFQVTLPDTASVGRFAMKTAAGWQEGEMVEKTKARTVYEDFLHRRQDPALLERAAGNEFSARVFPIAAHEEKHIVLAYSEELVGSRPYQVALAGLKGLEQLSVDVVMNGPSAKHLRFERHAMDPTEDLLLDGSASPRNVVLRSGDHALIRIQPKLEDPPVAFGNVMILFDTSASRVKGFENQLTQLQQLMQQMAKQADTHLTLALFDQTQELAYAGKVRAISPDVIERIRKRAAMGATDIYAAINFARASIKQQPVQRLIVMTDAMASLHDLGSDPIVPTVRSLREIGLERLDVILSGGIRDRERARSWVTALPLPGLVVDGELEFAEISKRLTRQASGKLRVEVAGASWFWPSELDGLQNGDEALVYAQLAPRDPIALRIGSQSLRFGKPLEADPALIERAWARAQIASLVERQSQNQSDESLKQQVIALSQRFRVISPFTALLVLETEADYSRYNVPRDANILEIKDAHVVAAASEQSTTPSALAQSASTDNDAAADSRRPQFGRIGVANAPNHESAPNEPATTTAPWGKAASNELDAVQAPGNLWGDAIGDARGAGGLGLSGIGEGGGGTRFGRAATGNTKSPEGIGQGSNGTLGHGAATARSSRSEEGTGKGHLGGSHHNAAPRIRAGSTQVSGRLPPEVIQRIVRQNYGRFRFCYERGLGRSPRLEGRVVVRFVIGRDGEVKAAANAGSDLPDTAVIACIVDAFRTTRFPVPEGGVVTVNYPILFEPGRNIQSLGIKRPTTTHAPEYDDQPWDGRYAEVMADIAKKQLELAVARAETWRDENPNDLLAWLALGHAYRAWGEDAKAARALGSIIDLWGFRADLRRTVAGELEAIHSDFIPLAVDSYRHALADRADHPSSRLWLAIALMKQGEYGEAFEILEQAHAYGYNGRYRESRHIFAELLQLCAAARIRSDPEHAALIRQRVESHGLIVPKTPSVRLLLAWESDANDVDFHVVDKSGTLANYLAPELPNGGGWLYADVTDGYGPECFQIDNPRQSGDRRYSLYAHYFNRGPMGAGLGKLEIVEHDGTGTLTFESRPYVVTRDRARVALGDVSFARH